MASDAMQAVKDMMFAGRAEQAGRPLPTVEELRLGMEELLAGLGPVAGATYEAVDAGGVPAEWAVPEDGVRDGVILYFHGGGYFEGSIATHRRLVTALAVETGRRALSVGYRLAPEHPHPAAVEDALAAYRWLLGPAGERAGQVIVAGDSAGGGLSAALLVALRDSGDPLPAGAWLISPWTDLAGTGESLRTRADLDPMIDPANLLSTVAMYLPDGDTQRPTASPLYADLSGLPPLLVHVGEAEVLYDDATRLVQRAVEAGVDAELETWPDAFHVHQMMARLIPEADEAIARAAAWIDKRLSA